jgi:hypothetical protein
MSGQDQKRLNLREQFTQPLRRESGLAQRDQADHQGQGLYSGLNGPERRLFAAFITS